MSEIMAIIVYFLASVFIQSVISPSLNVKTIDLQSNQLHGGRYGIHLKYWSVFNLPVLHLKFY